MSFRYLVTGGTGSFGSTMVRHLLSGGAAEVRVLSRDEAKQDDLRRAIGDDRLRCFLGDVRDPASVREAVDGVDHVFHAAALKQVPSCEFFPMQAVRTNVEGSSNVVEAASAARVSSVVCLSTDKAVYPINAMGMSKALMERVAQAYARSRPSSQTTVSVTRYGNVMYSRGSVIPVFVAQALAGEPMTVTDPTMTRFLMSLEDSVDLVGYAFDHARPGDLFVRKAPSCTIEVLARAVASVLGDDDPRIKVLGARHGEKLYESLLGREERARAQDLGAYYRVPLDARGLEYELFADTGGGSDLALDEDDYNSHNTTRLGVEEVKELLLLLPEIRAAREGAR
ncbi:NAD-dependent epimerase/dehydratase family protein [Mumia zhuanghuii]|uniref:UDP-glucose 4-epimerase n=2 Tax=Mumia TaxID=1546255 RepID=A0ABW1QJ53_9ACTN|nr:MULTISPECIES: polysaccharide biosynthesis protein [Mumia]KAA1425345.1 NAD-dependent epimerase/dehydratase family protein [Mumia zhuanghuii]